MTESEVLSNHQVVTRIYQIMKNLMSRNFAELEISDPLHIESIEESLSTHPQNFAEWSLKDSYHYLIKLSENRYSLSASLVSDMSDGKRVPSHVSAEIEIDLDPIQVKLINVTN